MDTQKTMDSLKRKGYEVSYFEAGEKAVAYLRDTIKGKTIGFGGSQTLTDLDLRHVLAEERCYDCRSPQRLCNGLLIYLRKVGGEAEVILINDNLGF